MFCPSLGACCIAEILPLVFARLPGATSVCSAPPRGISQPAMQSLNSSSPAAAPDVDSVAPKSFMPKSCDEFLCEATAELLQEWGRYHAVTCSQLDARVSMSPLPAHQRVLQMRYIALRPWLIRSECKGRLPYADSFAELEEFILEPSQFYQAAVPSVLTWLGDSMTLKEVILLCQACLSRARSEDFIFKGHRLQTLLSPDIDALCGASCMQWQRSLLGMHHAS